MSAAAVDRLAARFARLKSEGRAGLVTFVTASDPDFATSLAIVKGRTITQAQKALRKERPKIEQLTKRLTESLAALSTQWEVWKHDHQGS